MANPTEGLNALDQEREASMADEGGVSGAAMESEERFVTLTDFPGPMSPVQAKTAEWRLRGIGIVMIFGVGVALAGMALRRG